ncbi:MAG: PKD domain-containing protein [Desulfobacterales bacterium]|nr:PKD domain-containing protein [Desulfobacterales bacterium]
MMMRRSLLVVLTVVMLTGAGGFAYAQSQQITTLESVAQVDKGTSFDVVVKYNATPSNDDVKKFGPKICYDSSLVEFDKAFTTNFEGELLNFGALSSEDPQLSDECGLGATGKMFSPFFFKSDEIFSSVDTFPVEIIKLTFTALNTDGAAKINALGGIPNDGFEYVGNEISVQVGEDTGDVTLTLQITQPAGGKVTVDSVDYTDSASLTFASGTNVTLTATPDDGNKVTWAGAATGEANVVQVLMDMDKTVTATFVPDVVCNASAVLPATPLNGEAPLTVTFDTTGSVGDLSFNYGDGSPVGTASTHTYNTAGNYTVTLTATDTANNCTDTATQQVTVTSVPTCDETATFTVASNLNRVVTFNHTGSTGTLQYNFGDNSAPVTATGSSTTHTYAADGTYTVTLTASDPTTGEACDTHSTSVTAIGGTTDPCENYQFEDGDYDQDGEIDIFDALGVAMHAAGLSGYVITEECHLDALDVDGNDNVDINDALAIARYDVGLVCNCSLDDL